ncbi:AfsR/SARP family transcriptional regulator [Cellulomonas alba]|uniref:BTAD domain-containing putative transcriptional regulator n=1 Tax=Cellulomonas alba TaxID=3053467 RepID=A0ABT7SF06_9CELL|nr:BTAD domain-containing putative transcriptional regulator [Cellulomonas alba]MDM7854773.1 BTAD domain-containing putative transcriptional regulator [Cellulomonas alba]
MRITTLGELAVDGRPVRGERLATVVRALVDARGRAVSTAALVDAVWEGAPPDDATGAVQALVSRVRRLGVPVVGVPGGYRITGEDVHVDAVDGRALVDRAASALAAGDVAEARTLADEARALFPPVPDVDDPSTARLFADVTAVRANAALAGAGPFDEADLRRLAERTPPDEPSVALLVRVLAAQGRDAEALDVVERLRADLADRYGTDPSTVVTAAHLALLRGELTGPPPAAPTRPASPASPANGVPGSAPRTAAPGPPPIDATSPPAADPAVAPSVAPDVAPPPRGGRVTSGLPVAWRRPATALVGRDDELAAIEESLAAAPLVTLVATGGAGKTRLAAETARRALARGTEVRAVELAGVRDPAEVLPTVLAALGGAETTGSASTPTAERRVLTPEERLAIAAQDLAGLVVIDNCEHVLEAAAGVVAELVAAAPDGLVLLATSRAPLGVVGEVVHRVRALPDDDALGLLEARARAGRPDLAWDPAAALELCHRLDNLPLALELAAARLRAMPVEDVLDGLSDRFALLDDALRGLPERHASLWAMVDWSRELLDEPGRELLARLAVIPSSFTADAATAVAGAPGPAVRRGLAVLVEQSLLALDEGETPTRYRMLETVREYGEARLDAAGGRADAMAGLVRWSAQEAAWYADRFVGEGQLEAFAGCAREQDSFVAALRWAAEHDEEPAIADIAAALFQAWTVRGLHVEVIAWARRLLAADAPARRRASVFLQGVRSGLPLPNAEHTVSFGLLAAVNGAATDSMRLAALGWRVIRTTLAERRAQVSAPLVALADVLPTLTSTDPARMIGAAERLQTSDDRYVRAMGLFIAAAIRENMGDAGMSGPDVREAYRLFEQVGDHWGMGMTAQALGQWDSTNGRAESEHWLTLGVQHLEAVGAQSDARSVRVLLLVEHAIAGDEDAVRTLEDLAANPQLDPMDRAQADAGLARVAWEQGRHQDAVAYGDAAAERADGLVVVAQARIVFRLAAAMVRMRTSWLEDPDRTDVDDRTLAWIVAARDEAVVTLDMPILGSYGIAVAELCAIRRDDERAVELWALGTRLGANLRTLLALGDESRLDELLGDADARQARVAPLRELRPQAAADRLRALSAEVLGP